MPYSIISISIYWMERGAGGERGSGNDASKPVHAPTSVKGRLGRYLKCP